MLVPKSTQALLQAVALAKSNPDATFSVPGGFPMSSEELILYWQKGVHRRASRGLVYHWRHPLVRSFLYTDGVKHFASNAGNGAFWLLDILATEPAIKAAVLNNYIAYAKLKVQRKKVDSNACSAELVVYQDIDDDGEPVDVAYRREITYTDCPPGDWVFKLGLNEDENGRKIIIICLPIED